MAILWQKDIKGITPLTQIHHDRVCVIKFQSVSGAIINFLCVYMPAKGSPEDFASTLDELSAIILNLEEGSHNIVCGDLNADMGTMGGNRSNKCPNSEGKILANFVQDFGFKAANLSDLALGSLNTFDSPVGRSCIDYFLNPISCWDQVKECRTLDSDILNTSDHYALSVSINAEGIVRLVSDSKRLPKLNWKKLSADQMFTNFTAPVTNRLEEMLNEFADTVPSHDNLDKLVDKSALILRQCECKIPKSRFKKNLKPFWSEELKVLKDEKVKTYRAWCAKGRPRGTKMPFSSTTKIVRKVLQKLCEGYQGRTKRRRWIKLLSPLSLITRAFGKS